MTHSTPPSLCECEQEVRSLSLPDLQRPHSKMASRCRSHSLNPRLSLWLLALVLTWHSSVTESHAPIQLRGEVGGKVAFHCPVDKQRSLAFLYFQTGEDVFINGYHESQNLTGKWQNTILDEDWTIHMDSLNVSHNGAYKCAIRYRDNDNVVTVIGINLTVTANYSKPALVVQRSSEKHNSSCLVTCTSHGGYPDVEVKWQIPESCTVLNNSKAIDRVTMMVNRSSTAECNCSGGELTSIWCSVGNVTSDKFSVCTPIEQPDPQNPYMTAVAIALIAALLVLSIVGALLWWKCRKPQRGAVAVTTSQVTGGQHDHEELVILNENKEGKEAP